jgi:hypothetical protein
MGDRNNAYSTVSICTKHVTKMNLFNIKKTFEIQKVKGWPETYWCIDLHGTIIPSGKDSDDKTDVLHFYPDAKEVLRWLSKRKDIILILWTSTPMDRLYPVLEWFDKQYIIFPYVNENPHAKDTPRSYFGKKFYFNVLLDDRSGFEPDKDWTAIKNELIEIGEWDK